MSSEHRLKLPVDSIATVQFVYQDFLSSAVGYIGKHIVSFEESVITHIVEGGTIPFYIGTNQPRPFKLNGSTLLSGDGSTYRRMLIKVDLYKSS